MVLAYHWDVGILAISMLLLVVAVHYELKTRLRITLLVLAAVFFMLFLFTGDIHLETVGTPSRAPVEELGSGTIDL